jgi:two-component system sensor histidine kinase RegB
MPGSNLHNYLEQNLRYLLSLRAIAIGAQVVALVFMYFRFSLHFPLLPVILIIAGISLFTLVSILRNPDGTPIGPRTIQVQLIVDVIALSLLVYFTGGSSNPFIFFFLLPITFAAATLNFRQACLIAGLAALSYTVLMFFHVPLLDSGHHQHGFNLHIWGMWYGFLISSALLTYYVSRIGLSIRKRDRALARAREENLQADQVLALGTLAAGTAHELGTPLATMAVLARELEHGLERQPERIEDLRVLRQQIDRCKTILSRMAVESGEAHAEGGQALPVNRYLDNLVREWRELRPDQETDVSIQGTEPAPSIIAERTLDQAIHNVLNNAANACRSRISFSAYWDNNRLEIHVIDDGMGIEACDEGVRDATTGEGETGGLGIGLFLSRITLNRLGGDLRLQNRTAPDTGTEAVITLPLARLRTS